MKPLFGIILALLGICNICVMSLEIEMSAVNAPSIIATGTWQSPVPAILGSSYLSQRPTALFISPLPAAFDAIPSSSSDTVTLMNPIPAGTAMDSESPTAVIGSSSTTSSTSTASVSHGSGGFWTGPDPFPIVRPSSVMATESSTKSEASSSSSPDSTPTTSSEDGSTSTLSSTVQTSDQSVSTSTYITYVTAGGTTANLATLMGTSPSQTAIGTHAPTSSSDGQSKRFELKQWVVDIVALGMIAQRLL